MTAHAEDEKGKPWHAHDLAPSISQKYLAGVGHGMNMHKPTFHLANDESSVRRKDTNSNDNKDSSDNY